MKSSKTIFALRIRTTVLIPSIETSCAKLQDVILPVSRGQRRKSYLEWSEDVYPYTVTVSAVSSLSSANGGGRTTIFVDEGIRHFLV